MPGINSFKRGRRKCGWQLAILVFSLSAVLSACEGGGTSPNPPPVSANEWTWVSGSNTVNQAGVYGTKGVAASSNVPGAREAAVSWIDSSGKLWLFGGYGYDSAGNSGDLNDLWKYDGTNWTWVSGSNTVNQAGVYGTKGVGRFRRTSPGQESGPYPGSIPAAPSGCSGDMATIRQAIRDISMTCGSMTGTNGPGYPAAIP